MKDYIKGIPFASPKYSSKTRKCLVIIRKVTGVKGELIVRAGRDNW
jgi:hypothetical protein